MAPCKVQVAEELDGVDLRVITRSGNPAKPSEQRRAAAAAAETVVLLWPTGLSPADASAQQAAVLSALTTAGGVKGQKVVVQSAGELVEDYDAVKVRWGCGLMPGTLSKSEVQRVPGCHFLHLCYGFSGGCWQRPAVETHSGPNHVLHGAGSGKLAKKAAINHTWIRTALGVFCIYRLSPSYVHRMGLI